jgi:hypothetical protein
MTGNLTYDAHKARLDDFHRSAAQHRRPRTSGRHARGERLTWLVGHRRRRSTTRTATTTA